MHGDSFGMTDKMWSYRSPRWVLSNNQQGAIWTPWQVPVNINYRMAARPFKYDTWQFGILPIFMWHPPKQNTWNPQFSVSLSPQQLGFSLFVAAVLFLAQPKRLGFCFVGAKKGRSPIQTDSLGEALDRFFCISSLCRQMAVTGKASHSEGAACGVCQVNSLLEKHTHTQMVSWGGCQIFFG